VSILGLYIPSIAWRYMIIGGFSDWAWLAQFIASIAWNE
jgi:hypothetical protein